MIRSNIDRITETLTPSAPVQYLPLSRGNGQEACETSLIQFYSLDDLWESYREWSAYGVGVELMLNGNENVTQYFVPSLSNIQLYVDSAKDRPGINTISQKMNQTSISPSSSIEESSLSQGNLVFEYEEFGPPHERKPLFDMISALAISAATDNHCRLIPTRFKRPSRFTNFSILLLYSGVVWQMQSHLSHIPPLYFDEDQKKTTRHTQ